MPLTEKTPYAMVKNCDCNGLEAWRRLHKLYAAVTPQGKRQLLHEVMNHPRAKDYHDILAAQESWSEALRRHREVAKEALPVDILVAAYTRIFPDKCIEALRNLNQDLGGLEDVMGYANRWVQAHKPSGEYRTHKATPMDIGSMSLEELAAMPAEQFYNAVGWTTPSPSAEQALPTAAEPTPNPEHCQGSSEHRDNSVLGMLAGMFKGKGKGKGGAVCH